MALKFYNADEELFSDEELLHFYADGTLGGASEKKIYIKNDNAAIYYTDLKLDINMTAFDDSGILGKTGWGIKLSYGERQPTEIEWAIKQSDVFLNLPDIGDEDAADTSTFHPIWVRIYVPGGETAHFRDNMELKLTFLEHPVGA